MSETFKQHHMDADQLDRSDVVRTVAEDLEYAIKMNCPKSRERSLAMTNLEQAVMWANKAIAINGKEKEDA